MSIITGQPGGAAVPAAGWYPDPQGVGQRWWNGQSWTEHVQAGAAPQPAGWTPASTPRVDTTTMPTSGFPYGASGTYGTPGAYGAPGVNGAPGTYGSAVAAPVLKNTAAIAGFVFGVLSVSVGLFLGYWLGSAFAILLSANGVKHANALKAQGYPPVGRAMAIWGVALGGISLVVVLIIRISSI